MKTIIQFSSLWIVILSIVFFSQCQKSDELSPVGYMSDQDELTQVLSQRGVSHDAGFTMFKINNCIETVSIEGAYKFIFSDFKVTNGNKFSIRSHYESKGIGVGLKSGNIYEWINVGGKAFSGSFVNGQYNQTYRINQQLIGKGDVPNSTMDVAYSIRINANGEIVVDNFNATSSCD